MIKTSKNVSKAWPKAVAESRRGECEPVHLKARNPEMMEMSLAVKTIGLCLQTSYVWDHFERQFYNRAKI